MSVFERLLNIYSQEERLTRYCGYYLGYRRHTKPFLLFEIIKELYEKDLPNKSFK